MEIRDYAEALSTQQLITVADALEKRPSMDEEHRIAYAVVCAAAARRLDLPAQEVAKSVIGPAETFRLTYELRYC